MVCSSRSICRFPPGTSRWRTWSPEEASIGAVPVQAQQSGEVVERVSKSVHESAQPRSPMHAHAAVCATDSAEMRTTELLAAGHVDCHDGQVTLSGPSPRPVREQDVAALIGILAVVEGALLGGEVGDETTTKLSRKLVGAGLLSENGAGDPSAGQVAVALDEIIARLQGALGEYESAPEPRVEIATAHVMRFPTKQAADRCAAHLLDGHASRVTVEHERTEGWTLYAVYSELAPDPGFSQRVRDLRQVAIRFGGRYSGSQAPGN
jgi:hypothetical protein